LLANRYDRAAIRTAMNHEPHSVAAVSADIDKPAKIADPGVKIGRNGPLNVVFIDATVFHLLPRMLGV